MKRITFIFITIFSTFTAFAQNEAEDSAKVQAVFDALINLRDAAGNNDTAAIRRSSSELKSCNIIDFQSLQCMDDTTYSLNGHLLFDETFADSLAEGVNVYNRTDELNSRRTTRGPVGNSIFTRTGFVKKDGVAKYTFLSRDNQILAVVAESGGRVTLRIHAKNATGFDKRYNDTTDVYTGRPQRKATFQLPSTPPCRVELEVINCSNKDISFAVISN